jgi:hypothetical protein
MQEDDSIEALTVSEAIAREKSPEKLSSIFPGSWINANFDVWIGSPEDNLAWNHLSAARDFFSQHSEEVPAQKKELALEELMIAEGSDWNWWYGPEHHSANDRDFDELYRKHLSNVYYVLGAKPPDVLAQPIIGSFARPKFTPQTTYIHPQIEAKAIGYFDWLGAAMYIADRRSAAMHGGTYLLDTGYAGIDENNLYCRVDFAQAPLEWAVRDSRLVVAVESRADGTPSHTCRLEAEISADGKFAWTFHGDSLSPAEGILMRLCMESSVECRIPLSVLHAVPGSHLRVRFSAWRELLPLDALPQEGSIEVIVLPEEQMGSLAYAKP